MNENDPISQSIKIPLVVSSYTISLFHSLLSYPMTITVSPKEVHQVFFNYRGEQLRYNFVSHLTNAFERHNIKFFVDEEEQRGKDLKNLFVRIEESSVALAIFSTRFGVFSTILSTQNLLDLGIVSVVYNKVNNEPKILKKS